MRLLVCACGVVAADYTAARCGADRKCNIRASCPAEWGEFIPVPTSNEGPDGRPNCGYCEERLRVNVGLLKENVDLKRTVANFPIDAA